MLNNYRRASYEWHPLVIAVCLICALFTKVSFAQEVRILVLNSRTSQPVKKECLNISLGRWHGGDLIVPTNELGVVALHVKGDSVFADPVSQKACNGTAVTGPRSFVDPEKRIAVAPDLYVSCQEYGKVGTGEPLTRDTLKNIIPSYSLNKILTSGQFTGNSCGALRTQAKPGELVLFVRPRSWWQKAKQ